MQSPTMFIGIDPGGSGGLCCLGPDYFELSAMPETERDVWDWFAWYADRKDTFAFIEKVHSMPGNGVASMFKFGMNYGMLRLALIAAKIPFEEITPQHWQKEMKIQPKGKNESSTSHKNKLKGKAQQLFPKAKLTLKTADALLIAEYCRRTKR